VGDQPGLSVDHRFIIAADYLGLRPQSLPRWPGLSMERRSRFGV
jgi:hypothetical protein